MPLVNDTLRNFVGGELCPSVRARGDIKVYANGCERLDNFIIETTGPVKFRTGTHFVCTTRRNALARFLPFQFSDKQAYLIECTPGYFRFYKDNGIIVNSDKTITGITAASPAVVTCASHGFSDEDEVFINSVKGMETLNGKSYIVKNVTTDTFALYDNDGNAISTAGLTYTSGGVLNKIVEVKTPYTDVSGLTDEEVMDYLQKIDYTQNTDTMYIVHPKYPPRKLTRSSHTNWTFNTFTRTSDYMTEEGKYPGSVAFDGAGRLIYAGFEDEPDLILMSRGPDSSTGASRYDDFTTGTLANDAIKMYLAAANGKVIVIKWLAVNNRYFLAGTESGLLRIVPSDGYDNAFSAETLPIARPIDSDGCAGIKPIPKGNLLFYFQKGALTLRCLEYDLVYDSYKSVDKNLVADTITLGGCREIAYMHGRPDLICIPKRNGKLIGLTYHETEEVSGWQRFTIGGTDVKVLSCGIMPRDVNHDQLWLIVERKINGKTRRYVEYLTDFENFLTQEDFYTDEYSKDADLDKFNNDLFERQKLECHLDSSLTYDGSTVGTDNNATITIGDITTTDNGVKLAYFTSSAAIFSESSLDRQIWRIHDEGTGSGRASIVKYVSTTKVQCKILKDFDITTLAPGSWSLTTANISGLDHLEGETVRVVTDGALHPDCVVKNGKITLKSQADIVHVGLGYRGILKSTNLNIGGTSGSAQNKPRNAYKVVFEFLNTIGVKFGTSLYDLTKIDFRNVGSRTNRPQPLFSGPKSKVYDDRTDNRKYAYVIQDSPLPCTIQAIDVFMETVDE